MALTAIKCVSCGSNELNFDNGIATCKNCSTIHTTDSEIPLPGGSVRIIIPLTIAIGQTLRQSGILVGQCWSSNSTGDGTNPNKKLENNNAYLTILKREEHEETEQEGFIFTKKITVKKVDYTKICYIHTKKRSVTFFVQGQENMAEVEKIAREITPKFNCNCQVILDKE